jgi:starch synthase
MIAMRYGTIPVVRATGGLADTVIDADARPSQGTGFTFDDYSGEALADAFQRGIAAVRDPKRRTTIIRRAMERDFSWDRSAQEYARLYARALSHPRT